MTEAEWDSTDRPYLMYALLRASRRRADVLALRRKSRLVACAICRDMWDLLKNEPSWRAVEVSERFADGLAGAGELESARSLAWQARPRGHWRADLAGGWVAHKDAAKAAEMVAGNAAWARHYAPDPSHMWLGCDLIREMFGSPMRPATFDPAWRTADVMALARAAYDSRSLPSKRLEAARLGVLADALEEAGCADHRVLGHLRGPGPHVRGCWSLDLILAKKRPGQR